GRADGVRGKWGGRDEPLRAAGGRKRPRREVDHEWRPAVCDILVARWQGPFPPGATRNFHRRTQWRTQATALHFRSGSPLAQLARLAAALPERPMAGVPVGGIGSRRGLRAAVPGLREPLGHLQGRWCPPDVGEEWA